MKRRRLAAILTHRASMERTAAGHAARPKRAAVRNAFADMASSTNAANRGLEREVVYLVSEPFTLPCASHKPRDVITEALGQSDTD